jgi:hypothetical protein
MSTTTEQTYDSDLQAARSLLEEQVPAAGWPEGEREKAMNDALNNEWNEGMTLEEWVDAAARRLGR